MKTIRAIQDEIQVLKKEKNIAVAAHSYQSREILEIADYTGDSFKLSVDLAGTGAQTVILCGVHFMAETAKLLCPEKRIVLAHPGCGCAMAAQISPEYVREYKAAHPGCTAVCYINTTAALKAECDVCVTSSSALKIVESLPDGEILFVPDRNLGGYVEGKNPAKGMTLYNGCCPVHDAVTEEEVRAAISLHPNARLLVHPECRAEVAALADYVGSTSGIMEYAHKSAETEFIIGTEVSIVDSLSYMLPDKRFYLLSPKLLCPDMRITSLMDVYRAMRGEGGEEILLDPSVEAGARRCIDRMIALG
ncbi:MAG: quinolinate synthase NadA [Candidatus Howiella sp.]